MADKTGFADISILPRSLGLTTDEDKERERRELLLARCGKRLVGVFADEADHVIAWKEPTPLPRAPQSVLGVISVRGRISTVLDPLVLLNERAKQMNPSFRFIITLRGEEQLALAVERVERITEIFTDTIEPFASASSANLVCGVLQTEGELVAVINTRELFAAALEGTERRRRRS